MKSLSDFGRTNATDPRLVGKDPTAIALHKLGSVEFWRSDAYVRLNDIAAPFGKRVDNWMRLGTAQALLAAFHEDPAYNGATPIYAVKGLSDLPSHHRHGFRNAFPP